MEDIVPLAIVFLALFAIPYVRNKFKTAHLVTLSIISIYFLFKAITTIENRYFDLLVAVFGGYSVYHALGEKRKEKLK